MDLFVVCGGLVLECLLVVFIRSLSKGGGRRRRLRRAATARGPDEHLT